jgi:hypothetical protein
VLGWNKIFDPLMEYTFGSRKRYVIWALIVLPLLAFWLQIMWLLIDTIRHRAGMK